MGMNWFTDRFGGRGNAKEEVGRVTQQTLGAVFGIRNITAQGYLNDSALKLIQQAYKANSTAYGCITRLERDIGKIPLKFYAIRPDGEREEVEPIAPDPTDVGENAFGNIVYLLTVQPNNFISAPTLWTRFWRNRLTTGVGALEVVRGTSGRITAIEAPPVYEIAPKTIENGELAGYKIGLIDGGEGRDFDISPTGETDLFTYLNYDPENPFTAVSPAMVAYQAIMSSNYASSYNAEAIRAGLSAEGILLLRREPGDDPISDEQLAKARANLQEMLTGTSNANTAQIIEALSGSEWITLNRTNRDMQFNEVFISMQRLICQAYGVPPQLVYQPAAEGSTYNNLSELVRDYFRTTVVGEAQGLAAELTRFININAPLTDGRRWLIELDEDAVPVLREERLGRLERIVAITPGGITTLQLSVNELRNIAGYAKLPGKVNDEPLVMPEPEGVSPDDLNDNGDDNPPPSGGN